MNPQAELIKELKEEIEDLEEEAGESTSREESYGEVVNAIHKFCYDCSFSNLPKCKLCYLNRWKDEVL